MSTIREALERARAVHMFKPEGGATKVYAVGACGFCGVPAAVFINRNGQTRCTDCDAKEAK